MNINKCFTRCFCGRRLEDMEECAFYEARSGGAGDCLFLNPHKMWCCNPAAIEDSIVKCGLMCRRKGGAE